ncbi:ATP-dependent dethiobiotin synthetase BioD [Corynebacterium kalinowskii]|uniref:ATP-dependent dethiobiotin synthetase BioD n=1 Tax=Corynebacterium kalinowskii TaxID=2675216 RepID=A0A6B8VSG3_9CORY|nr:dethiobiotin synthase [Corynebacterium kalinowskii]QGU01935.1 ATP-dependent dethiobiotin synthetase BioD [Corynebacterium kalinowskii]
MIVIITGTNTDVGKTAVTAALALRLQTEGWDVIPIKPLQTGEPDGEGDAMTVNALTGLDTFEFARYPEPLAPNLAARRAGLPQASISEVAAWVREFDAPGRVVLVEGAGGLLVRLADDWTIADLAAHLHAPMIVVTSTILGSLNVAELTVEAAQRRGLEVLGLVGGRVQIENDLAAQLNLSELAVVTGVPYLGSLPEGCLDRLPEVAQTLQLPELLLKDD